MTIATGTALTVGARSSATFPPLSLALFSRTRRPSKQFWLWESLAAVGVSLLVALVVTWPLILHMGNSMFGPAAGDALGSIWNLWRQDMTGPRFAGTLHVPWTGAPFGTDQLTGADSTAAILLVPAYLIGRVAGEIVAWNVMGLLGIALPGATMYLLLRYVGLPRWSSAWGGLAFMLFPWHILWSMGGFSSGHLEALPLCILAVIAWGRRPTVLRAAFIALAVLLAWLSNAYTGLMSLVIVIPAMAVVALLLARAGQWRRAWPSAAATVGFVGLVLSPFMLIVMLQGGQAASGAVRGSGELIAYGLRPLELVAPTVYTPFLGGAGLALREGREHGSNAFETSVYLGLLTIALAIGWLVLITVRRRLADRRERTITWAACVVGLAGLIVAAPGIITIGGVEFIMPSRVIFEFAPFWRVYSRMAVVVMLAVVILAALFLAFLIARARRLGFVVALVAMALTAVELTVILPGDRVSALDRTPAYARFLAAQPDGIVAGYPLLRADQGPNSDWLFWQRVHRKRLFNGAPVGSLPDAVRSGLEGIADPVTVPALAALGVRYVVVNRAAYGESPPPLRIKGLKRIGGDAGQVVYQVTARPAGGVVAVTPEPSELGQDGKTRRWLAGAASEMSIIVEEPGRYRVAVPLASWKVPRSVMASLGGSRVARVIPAGEAVISLTAKLPAGRSPLRLRWHPAASALPDGRQGALYVGTPRVTRADGRPGARITSATPG